MLIVGATDVSGPTVSIAIVAVVVCYILLFWTYPERRTGIVKSPAGWPIVGHLKYLNPDALIPSMQQLASELGPVIELFLLRNRFVILCDVVTIKEVLLKRPKIFRRDKGIEVAFSLLGLSKHSLFSAEESTWSRLRKLLSTPFNKQNVDRMSSSVQLEIEAMLKALEAAPGGFFSDINEPMMQFTLRVILRVAFNNADIDDDYFVSNQLMRDTNTIFQYITDKTLYPLPHWVWDIYPPAIQQQVLDANARMDKVVGKIVENEKRKMEENDNSNTKQSFIQLLLSESSDEGKLTADEVIANIKTMILAGSETTSVSLSWALYYLSAHRRFVEKVREEADMALQDAALEPPPLPFCAACFKEVLRLKGPAALLGAALVDNEKSFTLSSGVEIRPYDTVLCTTEYLMLDPDIFPDPNEFNPMRWLTSSNAQLEKMNAVFFSFGYGSRLCPGIHLAKLEGELALAHILKNYDLKLQCAPEEVQRVLRFTVKAERIPMKFVKRLLVASI